MEILKSQTREGLDQHLDDAQVEFKRLSNAFSSNIVTDESRQAFSDAIVALDLVRDEIASAQAVKSRIVTETICTMVFKQINKIAAKEKLKMPTSESSYDDVEAFMDKFEVVVKQGTKRQRDEDETVPEATRRFLAEEIVAMAEFYAASPDPTLEERRAFCDSLAAIALGFGEEPMPIGAVRELFTAVQEEARLPVRKTKGARWFTLLEKYVIDTLFEANEHPTPDLCKLYAQTLASIAATRNLPPKSSTSIANRFCNMRRELAFKRQKTLV